VSRAEIKSLSALPRNDAGATIASPKIAKGEEEEEEERKKGKKKKKKTGNIGASGKLSVNSLSSCWFSQRGNLIFSNKIQERQRRGAGRGGAGQSASRQI